MSERGSPDPGPEQAGRDRSAAWSVGTPLGSHSWSLVPLTSPPSTPESPFSLPRGLPPIPAPRTSDNPPAHHRGSRKSPSWILNPGQTPGFPDAGLLQEQGWGWGGEHRFFYPPWEGVMELGAPCLRALDTVWTNLSARWGPCSGWRERWALKGFCQGFERGPGFFFPRSRAVLSLLFSAISGPRVSRKHSQVGLPASRREEAP